MLLTPSIYVYEGRPQLSNIGEGGRGSKRQNLDKYGGSGGSPPGNPENLKKSAAQEGDLWRPPPFAHPCLKDVLSQINILQIYRICSASHFFQVGRCLFLINRHIFRHLKLEMALAIPASNEWKIVATNSSSTRVEVYLDWREHKNERFDLVFWWNTRVVYIAERHSKNEVCMVQRRKCGSNKNQEQRVHRNVKCEHNKGSVMVNLYMKFDLYYRNKT